MADHELEYINIPPRELPDGTMSAGTDPTGNWFDPFVQAGSTAWDWLSNSDNAEGIGSLFGAAGTALDWFQKDQQKAGYQGKIPDYSAVREQLSPTGSGRRPGSGGQRYFTDTYYGQTPENQKGVGSLANAQAAADAQKMALSTQNPEQFAKGGLLAELGGLYGVNGTRDEFEAAAARSQPGYQTYNPRPFSPQNPYEDLLRPMPDTFTGGSQYFDESMPQNPYEDLLRPMPNTFTGGSSFFDESMPQQPYGNDDIRMPMPAPRPVRPPPRPVMPPLNPISPMPQQPNKFRNLNAENQAVFDDAASKRMYENAFMRSGNPDQVERAILAALGDAPRPGRVEEESLEQRWAGSQAAQAAQAAEAAYLQQAAAAQAAQEAAAQNYEQDRNRDEPMPEWMDVMLPGRVEEETFDESMPQQPSAPETNPGILAMNERERRRQEQMTYDYQPNPRPRVGMAQGGIVNAMPQSYLSGSSDGMADQVPAMIDNQRPASLSHGEMVIPADVVSHMGNGNSDAGAKQFYDMMDRVRNARTGNKQQGKQINPNKFMPR